MPVGIKESEQKPTLSAPSDKTARRGPMAKPMARADAGRRHPLH
jgi:hypothetical protein